MKQLSLLLAFIALYMTNSATAQTQSVADWLAALPAIEASEADAEVDALEMGAAMYTLFAHGAGDGRSAGVTDSAALAQFESWLTTTGNALLSDFYAGNLDPAAEKYLWILRAVSHAHYRSYRNHPDYRDKHSDAGLYFDSVLTAGKLILKKGYLGELLTEGDIQTLREYVMLFDVANTATRPAPHFIGLMSRAFPAIGDPAPDFYLPTQDTVLARPSYTDDVDLRDVEALNATALEEILVRMMAYTPKADGTVEPILYSMDPVDAANPAAEYVRLSDLYSDKPVLLLITYKGDGYWYRSGARDIEPIYQAYKEDVHFFTVAHPYDESAGVAVYTGVHQGADICSMRPHTQERLAFDAKQVDITDSSTSFPTLIDALGSPTASNYASGGGDAHWVLIDKNGVVAANPSQLHYNNGTVVRDYGGRDGYANHLEKEIRLLLLNEGFAVTDAEYRTLGDDGMFLLEREALTAARRSYFIENKNGASFIVDSVVGHTITATKMFANGSSKIYTLNISADTDLQNYAGTIDIDDFRPGNAINLMFYGDTYQGIDSIAYSFDYRRSARYLRFSVTDDLYGSGHITPRTVWQYSIPGDRIDNDVWVTGQITALDVDNQTLEVTMREVDANTFPGFRYYLESSPDVTLYKGPRGAADETIPVVASWVNDPSLVVYNLQLKASSEVYLDGDSVDISYLSIGQQVGFNFLADLSRTVTPIIVRASSPLVNRADILLDNEDSNVFSAHRFWNNQTWGDGFQGANWSGRLAGSGVDASAVWTPDLVSGTEGWYKIYTIAGGATANSRTANQPFIVHAGGQSTTLSVDLSTSAPGAWVYIMTAYLQSGDSIETHADFVPAEGTWVVADSLWLEPTDAPAP